MESEIDAIRFQPFLGFLNGVAVCDAVNDQHSVGVLIACSTTMTSLAFESFFKSLLGAANEVFDFSFVGYRLVYAVGYVEQILNSLA